MHRYSMYLVCECGWWDEPAHGNRWFSEQSYPCCPKCGKGTEYAKMQKGHVEGFFRRRFVPFQEAA